MRVYICTLINFWFIQFHTFQNLYQLVHFFIPLTSVCLYYTYLLTIFTYHFLPFILCLIFLNCNTPWTLLYSQSNLCFFTFSIIFNLPTLSFLDFSYTQKTVLKTIFHLLLSLIPSFVIHVLCMYFWVHLFTIIIISSFLVILQRFL